MTKKQLERALDAIYRGDPADFIGGRDALVKKLRTDDVEEAENVKRLRKPSKPAAVVNALALEEAKLVKKYLGLAEKLRKASSGKVDASKLRSLAREEGELLEELVGMAGALGNGASSSTLNRVRETLQAAQVDSALAEKVQAGRVEREQRAASVGLENLASPPQATGKRGGKPARAAKASKDDAAAKRAEQKAEARRKAEAEAKRKAVAAARAALDEAKAKAREAAREVARAERALAKAERARSKAG